MSAMDQSALPSPTPPCYVKTQSALPSPTPPCYVKSQIYTDTRVFEHVDMHAINEARTNYKTFRDLIYNLTFKKDFTDLEKARAIFRWMTIKDMFVITFDRALHGSPEQIIKGFKDRKITYARIFETLAVHSGLHCVTVSGWAKGVEYHPGAPICSGPVSHSWNAVYVDGSWQLVDSYCATHNEDDDFYFIPEPAQLIYSHCPEDAAWQLLDPPRSQAEFHDSPLAKSFFFNMGMSFCQQNQGVVYTERGILMLTLSYSRPSAFTFRLGYGDHNLQSFQGILLKRYVIQETTDNRLTFYFRAPREGSYYMTVFAQEVSEHIQVENVFKAVCEYKIICDQASEDITPYPLCSDSNWGPGAPVRQYGLTPSHMTAVLFAPTGRAEVSFTKTRGVRLYARLNKEGMDDDVLQRAVSIREQDNSIYVTVRLPSRGVYGLEIFANEPTREGDTFTHICQYLTSYTDHDFCTDSGLIYGQVFDHNDSAQSMQATAMIYTSPGDQSADQSGDVHRYATSGPATAPSSPSGAKQVYSSYSRDWEGNTYTQKSYREEQEMTDTESSNQQAMQGSMEYQPNPETREYRADAETTEDIHSEDEEEKEQPDTASRDIVFEIYTAKEAAEQELDDILGEIDQNNDKDYLPPTVVVIDKDAGENPDDESLVASRLRDEDGCVLIDGEDVEVAEEYHGADMESNITDGEALESIKSDSSASGYLSADNEEDNDDPMDSENDKEVDPMDSENDKEVDPMDSENDKEVDPMDSENDKEVDPMDSENDKEVDPMDSENDKEVDPMDSENDEEVDPMDSENDKEVDPMDSENDEEVDSMGSENDKEVKSIDSENDEEVDSMDSENDEEVDSMDHGNDKEVDSIDSEDDEEVDNNKTKLTDNKESSDNKDNSKQDDKEDANNSVGDDDISETVTHGFGTDVVDSGDDYYEGVSPNEDKENINSMFFVDRGENKQDVKDADITGSREIDAHDDDEQGVHDNNVKSDISLGFQQMQNEMKEKSTRMRNKKQHEITPHAKIDSDNTTPPKSKRRKVDMIVGTKKSAKKPAPFFTPHIRGERRNSSEKLKTPSPKHSDQSETSDAEVRSPQNNKEFLSGSTRKQTSPVKQKLSDSSPIKTTHTTKSPSKHSGLDQHEKVRDSPPSPTKRKATVEAKQSSLSRFIQNQMETSAGTDTSSNADSVIISLMCDKKTRRKSKLGSDSESISQPRFESPKGITCLDEYSQTSKNFVKVIASPEYFSTKHKSPSKKSRKEFTELQLQKSSEKKKNNKKLSINRKHSPTQSPMDNSLANNQEEDGGLRKNYADATAIKPDQNLSVISPQASTTSMKISSFNYIKTRNVRPIPINKTASATTQTKSSTSELVSSQILSQTDSNSSEAHVEDSVKQDGGKQKSCNASPLKPRSQRISSIIREDNSRSRRRKTLSGAELALPTVQEHEEVISLDSNTQNDTSPFKEPPRKTYSQRRHSLPSRMLDLPSRMLDLPSRMLDYTCESPSKHLYGASKRTRSVAEATESNDEEIEFSVENLTDKEDFLYVLASDSDRSEDSVAVRRSRQRTTSTSSVASDISVVSTSSVTLRARARKQNSLAKSIKSSAQKKALRRSLPVPAAPTPGDTPNRRRSARLQPPMEK